MDDEKETFKRLDKLDAKLEKIDASLINIDKTLLQQELHLKEHMRRSEANEKALEILKQEMKPVITHVAVVSSSLKILTAISVSLGVIYSLIKIIGG